MRVVYLARGEQPIEYEHVVVGPQPRLRVFMAVGRQLGGGDMCVGREGDLESAMTEARVCASEYGLDVVYLRGIANGG